MVKELIINFGTVAQDGIVELEWDITGDPNDIVHVQAGCGCTANAHVDKESKKIRATFTEDDAKGLTDEQKKDWYPSGSVPISKTLDVYLRDEHDLIVLDENNQSAFNPEKTILQIGFVGKAQFA